MYAETMLVFSAINQLLFSKRFEAHWLSANAYSIIEVNVPFVH